MLYLCPAIAFLVMFAFPVEAFPKGMILRLVHRVGHACAAGAPGSFLLWASPSMDNAAMVAIGVTGVGILCSGAILLPGLVTVHPTQPARQNPGDAPSAPQGSQPVGESFNDALWQRALTPGQK